MAPPSSCPRWTITREKENIERWSGVVYVNNADNDNNALDIRHLTIADSLSSCYGSPLYDIILSFSLQNKLCKNKVHACHTATLSSIIVHKYEHSVYCKICSGQQTRFQTTRYNCKKDFMLSVFSPFLM